VKIQSIKLDQFQSWQESRIEFVKPIIFALGQNNAGKSSLARAMEIALRGKPSLARTKALVVADLIREGAKRATIEVAIEPATGAKPLTIRRTIGAAGIESHINGSPVNKDVFDFYSPVGLLDPDGVFMVLCNATGFFDLEPDKQKAILEGLVDQSVPPEALAGLPAPQGPLAQAPKTLKDIEEQYTLAFAARREVKAASKFGPTIANPGPVPNIEAIETKLAGLREEERALIDKVGRRSGERKVYEDQLARTEQAILRVEAELLALGTVEAATKALTEARDALTSARTMSATTTSGTEQLKRLKAAETKLLGLKGLCVISDGDLKVPCPLNKETKGRIGEEWAKLREQIEASIGGAVTPKDVAVAETAERAAVKRCEDVARKAKELSGLRETQTALKSDLADLPADADTEPLSKLRARIQAGESNLATANAMTTQAAKYAEQIEARDSQVTRLRDLEALVKAFGPKGIRERLLSERIGAVMEALNTSMNGFGLKATLSYDPWVVRLNGRHPELASASERFRAGVAFQVALAHLTGLRFVIVDAVDILDKHNRSVLFGLLAAALQDGWIEQAVILATSQEAPKKDQELPDYVQRLIVRRGAEGWSEAGE